MNTNQALSLIAALGSLEFREMNDYDRMGFDGAEAHARICDRAKALAAPLADILGTPIFGGEVLAIVSGPRFEMHGILDGGEPFCYGFDIADLL